MDIEDIKKSGQIKALKEVIGHIIFKIVNKTFEGYMDKGLYSCLGVKIKKTRDLLDEIEELLKELSKIEPGNK